MSVPVSVTLSVPVPMPLSLPVSMPVLVLMSVPVPVLVSDTGLYYVLEGSSGVVPLCGLRSAVLKHTTWMHLTLLGLGMGCFSPTPP